MTDHAKPAYILSGSDPVLRLRAWIRDYGDQKQPHIADLKWLLARVEALERERDGLQAELEDSKITAQRRGQRLTEMTFEMERAQQSNAALLAEVERLRGRAARLAKEARAFVDIGLQHHTEADALESAIAATEAALAQGETR